MAKGMSVVEDGAKTARLVLVGRDDLSFELATSTDEVFQSLDVAIENRLGVGLQPAEEVRVHDHAVFDDFGQAAFEFAFGQRVERSQVDPNHGRLPERADDVLGLWKVDSGLSADAAIDHRKERRRDLEQSNPTVPRRGQKTSQIADDSPTDGDDHRLTVGAEQSHLLPKAFELLNGLARLTAGDFNHRGQSTARDGFANF